MKKLLSSFIFLAFIFIFFTPHFVSAQSYPGQTSEVKSVTRISKIFGSTTDWTREANIPIQNDHYYNIWGADLGAVTRYNNKLWFVLGDTGFDNSAYNTNFLVAYSSDTNLADGITMNGFLNVSNGYPHQALEGAEGNNAIPNALFTIKWGGKEYMFSQYMYPIEVSGHDHHIHYSQIAKFDDNAQIFRIYKSNVYHWPGSWRHFGMASFWADYPNGYLYMVGSPSGRFGGVKLARIPLSSFMDENNSEAFSYYLGNGQWSGATTDEATVKSSSWLIPPKYSGWTPELEVEPGYPNTLNWNDATQNQYITIAEFSVVFNPYLNKFILFTGARNTTSGDIFYYTADNIWGPWSQEKVLLPVTNAGVGRNFIHYGIYTSDGLWEDNGIVMYFVGSNWGNTMDDYAVYLFKTEWDNSKPNCSNLSGPTQITLGQSATYKADFLSLQGNLRVDISARKPEGDYADANSWVWNRWGDGLQYPGGTNANNISYSWTPIATGTYTVFCRSWNDSIAECEGDPNFIDGPPRYGCAGPNGYKTVNVVAPLPGDLNHDGKINISDYNLLLQNFGNTTCGSVADIDGNCKVDIFDYNILVGNFGK